MDPVEFAEFVDVIAIGLKVDWPPDKLYAMIKTERMATKNNWKLLTELHDAQSVPRAFPPSKPSGSARTSNPSDSR